MDDQDRLLFLGTLGEACAKTDCQIHAWCLMSNHFEGDYEPQGWYLGGEEIRQSALAKAQRIAEEELSVLGWSAQDLQGRRKGDPERVRIAARLLRETTMTLPWIADRRCLGAATHVAFLLQHHQRKEASGGDTLF